MLEHIYCCCSKPSCEQRFVQGLLVNHGTTRSINHHSMRRKQGQCCCINHMTRLIVERAVDAESVAIPQEIGQALHTGRMCDLLLPTRHVGIVPAHVETEALRTTGGRLPNATKTEQGERTSLQPLDGGKAGGIPPGLWACSGWEGSAKVA